MMCLNNSVSVFSALTFNFVSEGGFIAAIKFKESKS